MAGGATGVLAGLPFPPGLLFQISKCCEEIESPDGPYPQSITTPGHASDSPTFYGRLTWLKIKSSSIRDVCNIRLVCKQFRDASLASFASILGERRFRLTKIGLQDLQGIAACSGLAPYFKTLTFGSADVAKADTIRKWGDLSILSVLSRVKGDEVICRNFSDIHHALIGCHHLAERAIRNGLRDALNAFPKLAILRVDVYDRPSYLGGWLTAEQRQSIDDNFKPGTSFWRLTNGRFTPQNLYGDSDMEAACSVVRVLDKIGVRVQDLRLWEAGGCLTHL